MKRNRRGMVVAILLVTSMARAAQPAFEVVSIKPARFPNDAGFAAGAGACGFSQVTPVGPRVSFGTTTVCSLIRIAYDLKDYRLLALYRLCRY